MKLKAVIITLVVAALGGGYLLLADIGPLKNSNFGFGLTSALDSQKVGAGYSMTNIVLFVILVVIAVVAFMVWNNQRKNKSN
jgi:heme/copper-type cytochrome/quinol oxidase subunit 2